MNLPLDQDPRWRRFNDKAWVCPCCGQAHAGIFDLLCVRPQAWQDGDDYAPNSAILTSRHVLTEDFCILNDEHFFVRSVLRLPVIGSDGQSFGYGCWATLSRQNFEIYIDTLDSGEQQGLGPWFGWFSNRLNGYPETLNLKAQIHALGGHVRPLIELEPTDHPLAVEQRVGITFDRLLEIYALNGHDMCMSLVD